MTKPLLLACVAVAAMFPSIATAQSGDVVVMRRQIAPPQPKPASTPTPTPTPTPAPTPASTPTPTPTPVEAGKWVTSAPVSDGPACSAQAPATVTVTCRSMDGSRTLGAASCANDGPKPSTVSTVEDRRSCTYRLDVGTPTAWAPSSCTATATQDTPYSCIRSGDNAPVNVQTFCNHAAVVTQTAAVYSGCEGEWRSETSACGSNDQSTYTPICWKWNAERTSGAVVAETYCDPTKKPAVRTGPCEGHWTSANGACNSSNLISVTATCVNNTTGMTAANETMCNPSTKPVANQTCAGTWSNVANTCSGGYQTPTVTCQANGSTVGDTMCNPSTKPSTVSQSCGGSWTSTAGTCSNGSQTPTVTCTKNGSTVGSNMCDTATKPSTASVSCGTTWNSSAGSCVAKRQTPTVTCRQNGNTVPDSYCVSANKPATTEQVCTGGVACTTLKDQSFDDNAVTLVGDNVTTVSGAQSACTSAYNNSGSSAGLCSYNKGQGKVYYRVTNSSTVTTYTNVTALYSAVCR